MGLATEFEAIHRRSKQNRWMRIFTICCRVALAAGFLPSGIVKILGERFTDLSVNHPMGHYLEALHLTGYYYTFIGVLQVTAAILLLVPRTATLGALIYFPIILNICILSFAVCFDGSMLTGPLMVIANFYLLCWDYDKLKFVFTRSAVSNANLDNKFPVGFAGGVLLTIVVVIIVALTAFTIKPHNTIYDCQAQCPGGDNPQACADFCDCIHKQGKTYDECLYNYKNAINKTQK
jgi:uncharacterized membrane protein YphA (DoxX/SURF4 family)